MPLLGLKLGKEAGEAIATPIGAVGNIVTALFGDKGDKLDHAEAMVKLQQMPNIIQTEINKIEAQHRSLFVAGWRPFIGWVCGSSLLYNYVLRDLICYGVTLYDASIALPPALQMEHLITILLGMLGLGGLRTYEKLNGKAK